MKPRTLTALLDWVMERVTRECCPFRLVATAHFSPTPTVKGALPMAITLQVTQQFPLEIQPVDARGNPAAVDGAPVWSVSDDTLLKIEVAADGLSAVVSALGPIGSAQVTVRADARMGEEVREIVGTLNVLLVAAEAVALQLVAGVPTEIATPVDPADPNAGTGGGAGGGADPNPTPVDPVPADPNAPPADPNNPAPVL